MSTLTKSAGAKNKKREVAMVMLQSSITESTDMAARLNLGLIHYFLDMAKIEMGRVVRETELGQKYRSAE